MKVVWFTTAAMLLGTQPTLAAKVGMTQYEETYPMDANFFAQTEVE